MDSLTYHHTPTTINKPTITLFYTSIFIPNTSPTHQPTTFKMGVVEKGDTIYIPANTITEHKVKVEWQQNLAHKTQEYYSVPFFNKTQGRLSLLGSNIKML
jgi:hypothetical protein